MNSMLLSMIKYQSQVFFILLFLYGLYLAIRLLMRAEWQWLCLPFIGLPLAVIGSYVAALTQTTPFWGATTSSKIIWFYLASILVSLLSGFAVYWLMNKYRRQTIFIHLNAFFYFCLAFLQAGYLMSRFLESVNGTIIFQGFIVFLSVEYMSLLVLGVGIMDYRLRQLKAENKE